MDELDPELPASILLASEWSGTAQLARSALASPDPPAGAEAASLSQVEALMRDAALSPRLLRQSPALPAPRPWWAWLLFWRK